MLQHQTQTVATQRPFMETAEAMRVQPREQAVRGALVLAAYAVGGILALLGSLCGVGLLTHLSRVVGPYFDRPGWAGAIGWGAVWLVGIVTFVAGARWCFVYAYETRCDLTERLQRFNKYVDDWHKKSTTAYDERRGVAEHRTYTRLELNPRRPADFFAASVALRMQLKGDGRPSIDMLREGLYLVDDGGRLLLGTFTERDAALILSALAVDENGVIVGRGPKRSGRLADMSWEDYLERVAASARRIAHTPDWSG